MEEQPDAKMESRAHIGRIIHHHRGYRRVVQPSVPVPRESDDDRDAGEADRVRNEYDDGCSLPCAVSLVLALHPHSSYYLDTDIGIERAAPTIGSPDYLRKFFPRSYKHVPISTRDAERERNFDDPPDPRRYRP